MAPAVEVHELTKRYGDRLALDDVSLTIEGGECVAILGPNGAGKSTLMGILATLRSPTSGTATVAGASVTDEPDAVREAIGVAFQEPLTSKHLTAREVVDHHARLYSVPKHARTSRTVRLLEFVGLGDRAGDKVTTFSGGMKRRLDLARVLVTDPDVLLLDEPTTGLDPHGRREVQDRIRKLTREGTTVLLATHDLEEASRLADRVAILDEGELLAFDSPRALCRELGATVVRVELEPEGTLEHVQSAVAGIWGLGRVIDTVEGVEILLPRDDPGAASPGKVVDALEDAGVPYEQVTVRDPDLGDVFLELTGRSLARAQAEASELAEVAV